MAGDWIKIEKVTATKPEVLMLAATLQVSTNEALGLCVRFWSWCDDHLLTGHDVRVTTNMLDVLLGHAGFARALISVGWLCDDNGSLEVPNFERHLSDSAKNRALSTRKKQHQRAQAVPKVSLNSGDKSGTREEKRREEIKRG